MAFSTQAYDCWGIWECTRYLSSWVHLQWVWIAWRTECVHSKKMLQKYLIAYNYDSDINFREKRLANSEYGSPRQEIRLEGSKVAVIPPSSCLTWVFLYAAQGPTLLSSFWVYFLFKTKAIQRTSEESHGACLPKITYEAIISETTCFSDRNESLSCQNKDRLRSIQCLHSVSTGLMCHWPVKFLFYCCCSLFAKATDINGVCHLSKFSVQVWRSFHWNGIASHCRVSA